MSRPKTSLREVTAITDSIPRPLGCVIVACDKAKFSQTLRQILCGGSPQWDAYPFPGIGLVFGPDCPFYIECSIRHGAAHTRIRPALCRRRKSALEVLETMTLTYPRSMDPDEIARNAADRFWAYANINGLHNEEER